MDEKTIRRGRQELANSLAVRPVDRVRLPGGARPPTKKDLTIVATVQELIEPETAGDPITGQIWVHSSLRSLRDQLVALGHPVSAPTVGRLLNDLGYALHVNAKKLEASSWTQRRKNSSATSRTLARPGCAI